MICLMKLVVFLLWMFFTASNLQAAPKIPVVVTLSVLKEFTEQIGGPQVQVTSLMTGLEGEHTYTPKPSDVIALHNAKLLVKVGLGLEVWVAALIKNADRTDLPVVTTSSGVPLLRNNVTETKGERDGRGNPHIWLDPENVKIMMRHITNGLIQIDPAHQSDYLARQAAYWGMLEATEAALIRKVQGLPNKNIIVHHDAWPYYTRRFGFQIQGHILVQVAQEASAQHMAALIKKIKRDKIRVIVSEPQLHPHLPQMLADETGAHLVILSPLPGALPGTERYIDWLRYTTETLVAALAIP